MNKLLPKHWIESPGFDLDKAEIFHPSPAIRHLSRFEERLRKEDQQVKFSAKAAEPGARFSDWQSLASVIRT